eukprot:gene14830-biopygen6620
MGGFYHQKGRKKVANKWARGARPAKKTACFTQGGGGQLVVWRAGHGPARLWEDMIPIFPKTCWTTSGMPYEHRLASAGGAGLPVAGTLRSRAAAQQASEGTGNARATPAPPQSQKWSIARATPAPLSCSPQASKERENGSGRRPDADRTRGARQALKKRTRTGRGPDGAWPAPPPPESPGARFCWRWSVGAHGEPGMVRY